MFLAGGDDDDDFDFQPSASASSKLSSLFGGISGNKSSNLKYVAPKQPRSDSIGSIGTKSAGAKTTSTVPSGQQGSPQATPQPPVVLIAVPVHAYLYVNGSAQSQGRAMCCILSSSETTNFQLLMYRSKQDHLTRTRISSQFFLAVLPNNYANFNDDQQRNWSVMVEGHQYEEFVIQVGICCALMKEHLPDSQTIQDIRVGEGPALKEGDQAQVTVSSWSISNMKKGEQIDKSKVSQRIKIKDTKGTWEAGLEGAQKNTRRLIFVNGTETSRGLTFHDVVVERVRQKGEHSGRNTPLVDKNVYKEESTLETAEMNVLPEGDVDMEKEVPPNKASLVSRMARMGHALLPSRPTNPHGPPTDSESEVEEICRQRTLRNRSTAASSMEDLETDRVIRSRASTAHYDGLRPEPAPRPPHLSAQPQQLVVYQSSPWQHPAIAAGGYSNMSSGAPAVVPSNTPVVNSIPSQPAAPDPTLSLLFTETRSQSTDLKVAITRVSDKVDTLMNKVDSLEHQKQLHGQHSRGDVPSNSLMIPHQQDVSSNKSVASYDFHAFLSQITALVSSTDEMKAQLEEKEKTIASLNTAMTQLLQKNQKLLEEKTEMLMAKQHETPDVNASTRLQEMRILQEENIKYKTLMNDSHQELNVMKAELSESKKGMQLQQEELSQMKAQLQMEQSKAKELQSSHQGSTDELRELQEKIAVLETQISKLSKELTEERNSNSGYDQQLKAAQIQHQNLIKQFEETEAHLKAEQLKTDELQQQVSKLRSESLDVKQDTETSLLMEAELKRVKEENNTLQKEVLELRKSHSDESNVLITKPDQVVALVKKVMNTVFRTLKPQFADEESYTGAFVTQSLITVIRDTTLQLLEDVNHNSSKETVLARSHMNQNGKGEVASLNKERLQENINSNIIGKNAENTEVKSEGSKSSMAEVMSNVNVAGKEAVIELEKSGETRKEIADQQLQSISPVSSSASPEAQIHIGGILPESPSTGANHVNCLPEDSSREVDSHDVDCSYNSVSSCSVDTNEEKEQLDSTMNQENSCDKQNLVLEDDLKERVSERLPVIDMENTEARMLASEKSDSSRDSSLERNWRPQPPPAPLFSDEDADDDDDWLS